MPPANAAVKLGYMVLSQFSCVNRIKGALPTVLDTGNQPS